MAYQIVDPDGVEPLTDRPVDARSLSDAAGLENVALRVYTAAPGQQLPLSYHYHDEQEEVFYVLEGTLHVETPEEEFAVESGTAFVAEPGSPHRAFNPESAASDLEVLALGAPAVDDAHSYEG
ncbi:cupin domain-containing protein [Halostagnicola kamekurae]|uniref:Cupin domain-containing protein n=1 Tax=Halostagnicola kamekurae TaxID=619731 RepID=A0A1I6TJK5_9EURY|nr:cupin domain-containing protein [Halostagnicola kamekurae]SFS89354.1 Cupin domain-containing protein [Halostagnicola kamekurae]